MRSHLRPHCSVVYIDTEAELIGLRSNTEARSPRRGNGGDFISVFRRRLPAHFICAGQAASGLVPPVSDGPPDPEHGGRYRGHPETDASQHPSPPVPVRPLLLLSHQVPSSLRDRLRLPGPELQGPASGPVRKALAGQAGHTLCGLGSPPRCLVGSTSWAASAECYPAGRPGPRRRPVEHHRLSKMRGFA